jgi:hypothetical protein
MACLLALEHVHVILQKNLVRVMGYVFGCQDGTEVRIQIRKAGDSLQVKLALLSIVWAVSLQSRY